MGVIFVAGVHAVGKTTACTQAADTLKIAHYAASSLIKAEKADAISSQGKAVIDKDGNQELLIRGVEKACMRHQGRIILDGHFTLLMADGNIETLSISVFRALTIEGIVVFQDQPDEIAKRLQLRDRETWIPEHIAKHQNAELAHAHAVSTELNIPLTLLAAFNSKGLTDTVANWLKLAR